MNILIVSSYLPYPLFNGGHIRLYNLMKELSKKHRLTLICEIRHDQTEGDIKEVKKFCDDVITIPRKKQWSYQNILKAGFGMYPFLLVGHTLPEMKMAIVRTLNAKRFDVIHVETFYVMHNLPKTYLPVVLAEHNIEYAVYQRYAAASPWYKRPFLLFDIAKITYWEEKSWRAATRLLAVTEQEKKKMKRRDVIVVPNGVDIDTFVPKKRSLKVETKERRILFMGDFKWIQNRDSAKWIIEEIWPEVVSRFHVTGCKLLLWVVGKNMSDELKAMGHGNSSIILDEHAPDQTWKIYQKSDILLAPIKVGGGSSYKIIEAMASGVPVVTTGLSARALEAKDKTHLLVGETSGSLADATVRLLGNEEVYERIRNNARVFIEKTYSWEHIAKILENVYKEVIV